MDVHSSRTPLPPCAFSILKTPLPSLGWTSFVHSPKEVHAFPISLKESGITQGSSLKWLHSQMLLYLAIGSCWGLNSVDFPVDHVARSVRHHDWPHHLSCLRDPTGCHTDSPGHLLPKPHSQRYHMASRVDAHSSQVWKGSKSHCTVYNQIWSVML